MRPKRFLIKSKKIFQNRFHLNTTPLMILITGQSCKSGRAFRVGFGPKVDKNFGLNSGLRRTFGLGAQTYKQNNLATILNFSDLTLLWVFLGHDLGFKLVLGLRSGLYFRMGFRPELVGPFTILLQAKQT